MLTAGGDVLAQGGRSCFRCVCSSGCCGLGCEPPDGRCLARDLCVVVCFVCVPVAPVPVPRSAPARLGQATALRPDSSFLICTMGLIKVPVSERCCVKR